MKDNNAFALDISVEGRLLDCFAICCVSFRALKKLCDTTVGVKKNHLKAINRCCCCCIAEASEIYFFYPWERKQVVSQFNFGFIPCLQSDVLTAKCKAETNEIVMHFCCCYYPIRDGGRLVSTCFKGQHCCHHAQENNWESAEAFLPSRTKWEVRYCFNKLYERPDRSTDRKRRKCGCRLSGLKSPDK